MINEKKNTKFFHNFQYINYTIIVKTYVNIGAVNKMFLRGLFRAFRRYFGASVTCDFMDINESGCPDTQYIYATRSLLKID